MKALVLACFTLISAVSFAQNTVADKVASAMAKGDVAGIATHMVSTVDLAILEDENMLPRDQVSDKLKAFFKDHPAQGFEVKHKGKSKLDDHYRIGDLKTSKGTFRVTYFMKKGANGMKVKQLRIEAYD